MLEGQEASLQVCNKIDKEHLGQKLGLMFRSCSEAFKFYDLSDSKHIKLDDFLVCSTYLLNGAHYSLHDLCRLHN